MLQVAVRCVGADRSVFLDHLFVHLDDLGRGGIYRVGLLEAGSGITHDDLVPTGRDDGQMLAGVGKRREGMATSPDTQQHRRPP